MTSTPTPRRRGSAGRLPAHMRRLIARLQRTYPTATIALEFSSPLELLVALILAAQCTDKKVNEVTAGLFTKYRSAADYGAARRDVLEADIRPTGFFRNKARAIQACCQQLVERFGGEVPARLEDLLTLPGVGRKTANILLGNAFGMDCIGVDTHVLRLAQRLGLSRHTDPDRVEADLSALVPRGGQTQFCHQLQAHGRQCCRARSPDCPRCSVAALCPFSPKTPPPPPPRPAFGRGAPSTSR